jgi:hypothetical protein
VRLGTTSLDSRVALSAPPSITVCGEDVLDRRGRDEGPAPGDDNPSSSSCRRILLGRTIRFLIESSLVLASALGLPFDAGCTVLLSTG